MNLKCTSIFRNRIGKYIYRENRYLSTQISPKQLEIIKHLRKITNEGVTSCKKALIENNWDIKLATAHILGNQQTKNICFDENKLNFGRVAVLNNDNNSKVVAIELKTDCDIVASTKLFESVARELVCSVFEYLEQETEQVLLNKTHIFKISASWLDSIPIQDSKQDTLKNLLKRTGSRFGKPVIAENIYVCQAKVDELIGSYTHKSVYSSTSKTSVASRLGLVNINHNSHKNLNQNYLRKISNLIALQAVADPNYGSMDEFLSLKLLKYDHFNNLLSEVSKSINVDWIEINPKTTVGEALELLKSLKISEIKINAILYINSGKNTILMTEKYKSNILEMLMNNDKKSKEVEIEDVDSFECDFGKYIAYAYCKYNFNADKNEDFNGDIYLLIIKDNRTINLHKIKNFVKNEKKEETIDLDCYSMNKSVEKMNAEVEMLSEEDREVVLKKNSLNLKKLIISKEPDKIIERSKLSLIIEATVNSEAHTFNFCACLESGNKLNMFYYDPEELDYVDEKDTITLDNISIRDMFLNVKSVYNEEVLQGFSDVYNMLSSTLKKYKCKLKGFDEVENLFDSTLNNYRHINEINKVVNYDGLRINKCYLDEQIVESFSSFSYLDDSLIDFFNQFTYNYIMNEKQQGSWVILSTYFVTKLKQYKEPKEAYGNTWKWTRKFKRPLPLNHFIFIPINLSQVHWSLVIIAYPKYAIRYQSNRSDKKASIIHLDSLGNREIDESICEILKNYLYQEFDNRCKELKDKGFKFMLDASCWDVVSPTRGVPLQNNGYDCGIYLIEYIMYLVLNESIFSQIIPKYYEKMNSEGGAELLRSSKWFTQNQIQQRRLNMKQVLKLMKDNPTWSTDEEKIKYITDKMTQQY